MIADRKIPDLERVREFWVNDRSGGRTRLFQYRVPNTETNGVPIRRVLTADSLSDGLRKIDSDSHSIGLAYEVGSRGRVDDSRLFAVPSNFSLRVGLNSIRISGESLGESLVLLPFEYSSCLYATPSVGSVPVLVRLNGIQLAVQFDKKVDAVIRLRDYGLGMNSCWSEDLLPENVLK